MDIIENNIDKLIKLIEEKTGINSVLYIELISVEIRENSFFKVAGKGYNIDTYLKNVKNHLKITENSSLLLMKHQSDNGFIFLQKGQLKNYEPSYPYKERTFYYSDDRKYYKTEELRDYEIQWEKWIEMAQSTFPSMQHACFLHSELTIPFSLNSVKIISGIWVFFSKPVLNIQELEKILKTGIYEYIIYTLLPDKIQEIERQDTFDALAHAQKQYIHAIKAISKELDKDKEKQMLEYIYNSLNGFLAVSKLYRERTIEKSKQENISLSNIVKRIVRLFENLILADINILDLSIKGNDDRLDNLFKNNNRHQLFFGNFRDYNLSEDNYKMYVPEMLIKEAVVNSLENANSADPKITIDFKETETKTILLISNNGLATEKDIKEIINPQNPYKLGCRLIIDLSNILGWEFKAESNYKDHTTYGFIINK